MKKRVIISGGGTGGHIFPAISIATELKSRDPEVEVLFVGAKGGMEMTLVPQNHFPIEGVWISGIYRSMNLKSMLRNLSFPLKLGVSLLQAQSILKRFQPSVVVGVGGYASGPLGRAASSKGIPLVLCEQNAFPGITNKWLAPKASIILLGNDAAKKYFEGYPCRVTGNPVRPSLKNGNRESGFRQYGLDPAKPLVLSLGGSLGAGPVNRALEKHLQLFADNGIQLIWQCGKRYYEELKARIPAVKGVVLAPFIDNMPDVYAAADLVVSRAGGSTISELILLSKPSILLPSPNVAEDHQTKNALSLVEKGAALMIRDSDADEKLVKETIALLNDTARMDTLRRSIASVEKHDSAKEIADVVFSFMK